MWPLLILSIVSIGVILEREFFFIKNKVSDSTLAEIKESITSGSIKKAAESAMGSDRLMLRFISTVFENSSKPIEVAEKEISLSGDKLLFSASRFIHIQELIGSISPMLGLSGTVVGLVLAFREIGLTSSGQIDPSLLAGGIWVAMITTVAGLFTAIPSLIFAHINRTRIKKLAFNMKIYGEEINTLLRDSRKMENDRV